MYAKKILEKKNYFLKPKLTIISIHLTIDILYGNIGPEILLA